MDDRQALNEFAKRVRAQRHSVKRKLDAIGIKALCAMINASSVKAVARDLEIHDVTIYKYLELNGARREIRYVLKNKRGVEK